MPYNSGLVDQASIQNSLDNTKIDAHSSEDVNEQDDAHQYPGKLNLFFIILSRTLALFIVGLVNAIISNAIPKITDEFHALSDVRWYASAACSRPARSS